MSLKVPWVASLASSTEWTTQWAAYLNIFIGNERKMIVNLKKEKKKPQEKTFLEEISKLIQNGNLTIWIRRKFFSKDFIQLVFLQRTLTFTWDETQAVRRIEPLSSSTGIPTVSINLLSSNCMSICESSDNIRK